jgi:hypothetical protein
MLLRHLKRVKIEPTKPPGPGPNWQVAGFEPDLRMGSPAHNEAMNIIYRIRGSYALASSEVTSQLPALYEMSDDWSVKETNDPLQADERNSYRVEKWTKDGTKIDRIIYAGSNLDTARSSRRRSSTGRVSA